MAKCRTCKQKFKPQYNTLQATCSVPCALDYAVNTREKKERKELRKRKQDLRTLNDWLSLAQSQVNRYIRARDYFEPCISCGTTNPNIQYCAGHYKTRGGFPELRFDEDNIHKQCNKNCNLSLSGNIAAYRVNLIKKIGLERVERLEGHNPPKNYTIEDAKAIKAKYAKLARQLEKENEEKLLCTN